MAFRSNISDCVAAGVLTPAWVGIGELSLGRIRTKKAARKADPPEPDQKTQEERQRIAEHIARALREVGYEFCLGDDSTARRLKRDH